MRRAAVLTLPLTTQVHEATRFQNQIDGSRPRIEELEGVVTSLSDQSELSSAKVKLEHIQKEYDTLKKLTSRRCLLLGSFLPRIKLYEGSVGNWEELLSGWEESAASLAPPTANLAIVQSQIETIKVCIKILTCIHVCSNVCMYCTCTCLYPFFSFAHLFPLSPLSLFLFFSPHSHVYLPLFILPYLFYLPFVIAGND